MINNKKDTMVWDMMENHATKYRLYFYTCSIQQRFSTAVDLPEDIHRIFINFLNTKIVWNFDQLIDPFFALFSINYYVELDF